MFLVQYNDGYGKIVGSAQEAETFALLKAGEVRELEDAPDQYYHGLVYWFGGQKYTERYYFLEALMARLTFLIAHGHVCNYIGKFRADDPQPRGLQRPSMAELAGEAV